MVEIGEATSDEVRRELARLRSDRDRLAARIEALVAERDGWAETAAEAEVELEDARREIEVWQNVAPLTYAKLQTQRKQARVWSAAWKQAAKEYRARFNDISDRMTTAMLNVTEIARERDEAQAAAAQMREALVPEPLLLHKAAGACIREGITGTAEYLYDLAARIEAATKEDDNG
jgi:chromosome segregation ATPase